MFMLWKKGEWRELWVDEVLDVVVIRTDEGGFAQHGASRISEVCIGRSNVMTISSLCFPIDISLF